MRHPAPVQALDRGCLCPPIGHQSHASKTQPIPSGMLPLRSITGPSNHHRPSRPRSLTDRSRHREPSSWRSVSVVSGQTPPPPSIRVGFTPEHLMRHTLSASVPTWSGAALLKDGSRKNQGALRHAPTRVGFAIDSSEHAHSSVRPRSAVLRGLAHPAHAAVAGSSSAGRERPPPNFFFQSTNTTCGGGVPSRR
jgi:hypothetical protein